MWMFFVHDGIHKVCLFKIARVQTTIQMQPEFRFAMALEVSYVLLGLDIHHGTILQNDEYSRSFFRGQSVIELNTYNSSKHVSNDR